jgi:gallate dioxygenase
MAKIIGGIATSHTPTIGFAQDAGKHNDPVWAPIFKAFGPVKEWLLQKQPDVLLMVYNDHVTSFFFDHYSAFVLGVDDRYAVADEGGNPRDLPPVLGHAPLARHIGNSLMADEFDMSFFRDKPLDHGCFSPLSTLWQHADGQWPGAIVPLQVGVLQFPVPTARRCYKLGQALRRAIESFPEDLKVVIVATGGLSHQVHGERAGFNNVTWDHEFLDLFERDPVALTALTQADYAKRGGLESAEVIMWLVMRGAMSARLKCLHSDYYLPSMTGIAVALYENESQDPTPASLERHRQHMSTQLSGIEELSGTYPFSLDRAALCFHLNKFLHQLIEPEFRASFRADEEACYDTGVLSEVERDLLRRRDWRGLLHHGVIFFLLEKLGAVVGVSNLHIYAAMRGLSLDDFLQTRNAPGALYSVAGKQDARPAWEQAITTSR